MYLRLAKDDFKLLILESPALKYWEYRLVLPHPYFKFLSFLGGIHVQKSELWRQEVRGRGTQG